MVSSSSSSMYFPAFFLVLTTIIPSVISLSTCNGPCKTYDDCKGQLACFNGLCNDDCDVGTHICSSNGCCSSCRPGNPTSPTPPPPVSPSGGGGSGCGSSGTLRCGSNSYTTYACSPPVSASTSAFLTNNDFEAGGDGGGASECDGKFHSNTESIVALSTGWYSNGSRCLKMIHIWASNGRTTTAKVVDECDSMHGCDAEHAYQPPCKNNIVDASNAVWAALGLDVNLGVVPVTWAMA